MSVILVILVIFVIITLTSLFGGTVALNMLLGIGLIESAIIWGLCWVVMLTVMIAMLSRLEDEYEEE